MTDRRLTVNSVPCSVVVGPGSVTLTIGTADESTVKELVGVHFAKMELADLALDEPAQVVVTLKFPPGQVDQREAMIYLNRQVPRLLRALGEDPSSD